MSKKTATRFMCSYYHTPVEGYRDLFFSVLRSGHDILAPDYHLESWSRPGHDLLLSVAGSGSVRIDDRSFPIETGDFAWVDTQNRHVVWPNRSGVWEFLWLRMESAQLDPITAALGIEDNPIFRLRRLEHATAVFKNVHRLMRECPVSMDAALHAEVSALIAILFDARHAAAARSGSGERSARPTGVAAALEVMRTDHRYRWTVEELARIAGLSPPHFFRRFHQATGSSPMNWLRRERVNDAKRRLGETRDPVHKIAEQLGYPDPLYFSRDFKKLVGVSPRHYRRHEQGGAQRA